MKINIQQEDNYIEIGFDGAIDLSTSSDARKNIIDVLEKNKNIEKSSHEAQAEVPEAQAEDTEVPEVSAVAPKYTAFVNERPVESVIFKFADIVPSDVSILVLFNVAIYFTLK